MNLGSRAICTKKQAKTRQKTGQNTSKTDKKRNGGFACSLVVRRGPAWVRVPQLGPGRFLAVDEQRRQDFVSLDRPNDSGAEVSFSWDDPAPELRYPVSTKRRGLFPTPCRHSRQPSVPAAAWPATRQYPPHQPTTSTPSGGRSVPACQTCSRDHAKPPFRFYRFLACFCTF